MKRIAKFAMFLAAPAMAAGAVQAADLPRKGAPPVYVAPAPVFTWSGFYAGLNFGYSFANTSSSGQQAFRTGSANVAALNPGGPNWQLNDDFSGVIGGGQVGYNWQFTPALVLGLEADIQASSLRSSASVLSAITPGLGGANTDYGLTTSGAKVDYWGTLRGRLGVNPFIPNLLFYATGGLAWGHVNGNVGYSAIIAPPPVGVTPALSYGQASLSSTRVGWTAGAGVEWAPTAGNWSVKLEYLYTDLGRVTRTVFSPGVISAPGFYAVSSHTTKVQFHTFRVGANYRFGWDVAAPVVAKY